MRRMLLIGLACVLACAALGGCSTTDLTMFGVVSPGLKARLGQTVATETYFEQRRYLTRTPEEQSQMLLDGTAVDISDAGVLVLQSVLYDRQLAYFDPGFSYICEVRVLEGEMAGRVLWAHIPPNTLTILSH